MRYYDEGPKSWIVQPSCSLFRLLVIGLHVMRIAFFCTYSKKRNVQSIFPPLLFGRNVGQFFGRNELIRPPAPRNKIFSSNFAKLNWEHADKYRVVVSAEAARKHTGVSILVAYEYFYRASFNLLRVHWDNRCVLEYWTVWAIRTLSLQL